MITLPLTDSLDHLRAQLPGVLAEARANSTNKLYANAYKKWKAWTIEHKLSSALPANPQFVVLYLLHLAQFALSFSVIKVAYSSLVWAHKLAGFPSPLENSLVTETLAGLKFRLAKPRQPKTPFTLAHIQELFEKVEVSNLTDVRNVCFMGLAFFAFLRFDEVVHIKTGNVTIHKTHVELLVEKAKNDQLRQGNVVVIARRPRFCPVEILQLYLQLSQVNKQPCNFLFRRIVLRKGVKMLHDKEEVMKYSTVRDIVKGKAITLGLNPSEYGTHSLRAGGCTTAANSGVSDRLFQRHGRWASVAAKDGYVKDSLKARLSVTQSMF